VQQLISRSSGCVLDVIRLPRPVHSIVAAIGTFLIAYNSKACPTHGNPQTWDPKAQANTRVPHWVLRRSPKPDLQPPKRLHSPRTDGKMAHPLLANTLPKLGQPDEWLKAAARKGCYTTRVGSEVRILPLSAKSEYCAKRKKASVALLSQQSTINR